MISLRWDLTVFHTLFDYRLPLSSMVFGLNALVTKPAQSIAPVMVVYILSRYGYKVCSAVYFVIHSYK